MKTTKIHNFNLTTKQARRIQENLRTKIKQTPLEKTPQTAAGLDCAFDKTGKIYCVAAVFDYKTLDLIETKHACGTAEFPYIPGLLSFREAEICTTAAGKLHSDPDIFLIDGQGIAHPRNMGLASHLSLFLDKPTIGCAKSRLTGSFTPPLPKKGKYSYLRDKENQIIGSVLTTRDNVKPLFISVGNRCTLKQAIEITLNCTTKYRLPEPTRTAHNLVSKLKKNLP